MVERFTKQVMEYGLGTPTRRVEISGGPSLPTFSDFNESARKFARELVTALRAESRQHSDSPPRRPQLDIRKG